MSHPQDLPLREQARAIASGELDPGELLDATFARIEERDGALNSVVVRFPDEARRMLSEAPDGPLRGVPVVVKDMFRLPWYAPRDGAPEEAAPPGESAVYRRLRDAGAVIVGIGQSHYWGAGSTGHVSAWGACGNPWNPAHCAGGSSGGSASAVGGRLVGAAVGTDGGGSVRLPAAYCGVTGMKVTYGAIPVEGYTHGYSDMGAIGPMCRDAADARLFGGVLMGDEAAQGDGSRLRVGIVRDPWWTNLDPEIERACEDAIAAAGWETVDLSLAGAEHAQAAALICLTVQSLPMLTREELEVAEPVLKAVTKFALLISSVSVYQSLRVRSLLRRQAAAAFERCDVLAWPTVPAPAPPIENPTVELPSGRAPADPGNLRQTGFGNLTGIPGISVPVGLHSEGLPMALQLQAPWGEEARLFDAAEHLEEATGREFVEAQPETWSSAPVSGSKT
jgi:Asp-tRNA(Asn)/Glu-tRNA(Gln) amidotransferase A subunit family amidase